MTRNFQSCRTVFYDCMDEFCANKDATLKRCACSARAREFDGMKEQLTKIEDKLLDFSQRLLTVNMDKEDALALNQATEGELAYAAKDTSESKKMLDQISKKLNTSFNNSNFDQNLNAISLSLNMDAAFDNIDSMAGASMTTKSGADLYNAALPVCREMAAEVCTPDDLIIAESGYQMSIEQDCNTVAKAYESQNDQARSKILESSALLDMSRLNIHQQRNSDDILTCKKKMLDMLTDSTVCGDGMSKCLDTTGRYIDPSTGEAFLTVDLVNLGNLITRPSSGQTWTKAPGNDKFISFLENKKKFLEPAMENCQDIADYVWADFIEDALAQIKLAQESKLEQMRQSCTTLTTQCLDDTLESISEFDSRALSVFGVAANKTASAMCSDIRTACTALLNSTYGDTDWDTGMTAIAAGKTYETILSTCREVGRQCIMQSCKSVAGNFALCENIYTSINRKSIINRTACWNEVAECVASAGSESINQIMTDQGRNADIINGGDIYQQLYGSATPIHDWCKADLTTLTPDFDWQVCRLSEEIWGNCEHEPKTPIGSLAPDSAASNKILINNTSDNRETLLSWFARNTGTENSKYSCVDTTCPPGDTYYDGKCIPSDHVTTEGICEAERFLVYAGNDKTITNCCTGGLLGNNICCKGTALSSADGTKYCLPESTTTFDILEYNSYTLMCIGGKITFDKLKNQYTCDGAFIIVNTPDDNASNVYGIPLYNSTPNYPYTITKSYIYNDQGGTCTSDQWNIQPECPTPTGWSIEITKEE